MLKRAFHIIVTLLMGVSASGQSGLVGYESWLDGDYAHRTVNSGSGDSISQAVDISNLPSGIHYYNVRCRNTDGEWGSVYRYLFLVSGSSSDLDMAGYESWLDGDYAHRTVNSGSGTSVAQAVDISNIPSGVHYYNVRCRNTDGVWGSVYRYLFFVPEVEPSEVVVAINYWFDDETVVKTQPVSGTTITLGVDISQLSSGEHTFHYQLERGNRDTTNVYSYPFMLEELIAKEPVITHGGNTITISMSETDEQTAIYYTLDGTTPSASNGVLYEKPFEVTQNGVVKAVSVKTGYTDSPAASLTIDWFKVADVEFAQNGNQVSMSTTTDNATIHYTLSNNEEGEQVYDGTALIMTGDCTIEAYAARNGYNNSDTTRYEFHADSVTCSTPHIVRNGNKIGMSTTTEQAAIYYTMDASTPTAQSAVYTDSIMVERNCTIKAIAMRENYYPSQIATFEVNWFKVADVEFAQDGNLLSMSTATENATIRYTLSNNEAAEQVYDGTALIMTGDCIIEAYATRYGYYNSDTTHYEFHMPNNAKFDLIAGRRVLYIYGDGAVSNILGLAGDSIANTIAAIIWDNSYPITINMMEGIENPNLLLYVSNKALAPGNVKNVVVGDSINGYRAQQIVLKDMESGNGNFFCPIPFTANRITYEREFLQYTEPDSCRGWETIVLPFAVQSIMHERNGALSPFAGSGEGRPFWLRELTTRGFIDAAQIEANKPYVISMPNYGGYDMEYQLGGWVTFSAYACNVPKTILQTAVDSTNTIRFIPAVCGVAQGDSVYALNVGEEYMIDHKKFAEGSVFVAGLDEVRPFRCYTQHVAAPAPGYHAPRYIPLAGWADGDVTGINEVIVNGYATVPVYNLNGQRVVNPQKGLYIVNGKKTVTK